MQYQMGSNKWVHFHWGPKWNIYFEKARNGRVYGSREWRGGGQCHSLGILGKMSSDEDQGVEKMGRYCSLKNLGMEGKGE